MPVIFDNNTKVYVYDFYDCLLSDLENPLDGLKINIIDFGSPEYLYLSQIDRINRLSVDCSTYSIGYRDDAKIIESFLVNLLDDFKMYIGQVSFDDKSNVSNLIDKEFKVYKTFASLYYNMTKNIYTEWDEDSDPLYKYFVDKECSHWYNEMISDNQSIVPEAEVVDIEEIESEEGE